MEKKFLWIILVTLFLIGCTDQVSDKQDLPMLSRVDVFSIVEGTKMEEFIIMDEKQLSSIREIFGQVQWYPDVEAEMERMEDFQLTLFYTYDENMPERLFEYKIWFNEDGTSTIISDAARENFGGLDKDGAGEIKLILSVD
ncbi:hypothetical protein LC085_12140 [Bacillus tianshenii]|uniref:hypothetical protein n=1 Tax=Sutcliffiella tianshenii TaxID=1463404 RepID=UPI001CD28982|nr:hypothetical protein [Bacillus tianshenii]MCA1320663.1 hypothetical protein [Bacillus tianshenii]